MNVVITSEVLQAYSLFPRKARKRIWIISNLKRADRIKTSIKGRFIAWYRMEIRRIYMPQTDKTIQEIYQNIVATLPLSDRLRLAALILNDLTQQNVAVIDASNTWTEQDQLELTSFSLQYANSLFPDEEEMV
jgi:hypothetical protein